MTIPADRSRRAGLQRVAGELGLVLPRVMQASLAYPAVGWYLRPPRGETIFLGDNSMIAATKLAQLAQKPTKRKTAARA